MAATASLCSGGPLFMCWRLETASHRVQCPAGVLTTPIRSSWKSCCAKSWARARARLMQVGWQQQQRQWQQQQQQEEWQKRSVKHAHEQGLLFFLMEQPAHACLLSTAPEFPTSGGPSCVAWQGQNICQFTHEHTDFLSIINSFTQAWVAAASTRQASTFQRSSRSSTVNSWPSGSGTLQSS